MKFGPVVYEWMSFKEKVYGQMDQQGITIAHLRLAKKQGTQNRTLMHLRNIMKAQKLESDIAKWTLEPAY